MQNTPVPSAKYAIQRRDVCASGWTARRVVEVRDVSMSGTA